MKKINTYNYLKPIMELINEYSVKATDKVKLEEAKTLFKDALQALEDSVVEIKEPEIDEEALLEEQVLSGLKPAAKTSLADGDGFTPIKGIKQRFKQTIVNNIIPVIPMEPPSPEVTFNYPTTPPNETLSDEDLFDF